MKILFHFTITLFVLSLVACNQTKSPEPVKQYTFIGGKEGDKMDTTSFDSLQLSDPFILADEETQMYYLVGSGGSLWKSTNLKMWTGPYQYITVDTTSWIGTAPRIWAPELHKYKGKYYCFVTFTNPKIHSRHCTQQIQCATSCHPYPYIRQSSRSLPPHQRHGLSAGRLVYTRR